MKRCLQREVNVTDGCSGCCIRRGRMLGGGGMDRCSNLLLWTEKDEAQHPRTVVCISKICHCCAIVANSLVCRLKVIWYSARHNLISLFWSKRRPCALKLSFPLLLFPGGYEKERKANAKSWNGWKLLQKYDPVNTKRRGGNAFIVSLWDHQWALLLIWDSWGSVHSS